MSRHLSFFTVLPLAAVPVTFLAISACSTSAAQPVATPIGDKGAICAADQLDRFKGRPASQALGAELLAASGAKTLRWVQPGMAVTMDFRPDRVTVELDAKQQVVRATCG